MVRGRGVLGMPGVRSGVFVRDGGGFVYVDYLNPDTGKPGMKLCYVAPVDDTWLVGSGIYTDRL
jgi:signal transduction histidine kinase